MATYLTDELKAVKLLKLTESDVGTASYRFLHGTVKRLVDKQIMESMTPKQQKWFDDLYYKHFMTKEDDNGS